MLSTRRTRFLRFLFCAGWIGTLIWAFRQGVRVPGSSPEHLLGLLIPTYLAVWGPYFLLSQSRPGQTVLRFALCTGSILASLVLFEAAGVLGLVDYRALFATPTPPWKRPGNRPDAELLYIKEGPRQFRPFFRGAEMARMRGVSGGHVYQCAVHLDSNGFRNPQDLASADVVVIGDSFIEGLQVAEDELLTTRLSQRLGRTVANLGRTGYGPQQELCVLRRYGLGLHPRTCIWAFYEGNDLQDLNFYEAQQKNLRYIVSESRSRSLYGESFTRNSLGFVIHTWITPDPGLDSRLHTGWFTDQAGREHAVYFATGIQHGEEGPALPRKSCVEMNKFRDVLQEAGALCKRNGVKLIVAFIPAKFRICREFCRFEPGSPCLSWPTDDLPRVLQAKVHDVSTEIGYLDLTPHFRARTAAGSLLYLADDTHWSPEGHRAAANAFATHLDDSILPRDTTP